MNSLSFHAAQGLQLPKPPSNNGTKGQVQAALWLDGRQRHVSPPVPCFPKVALLPREMGSPHRSALTALEQLNSHYTIPPYSNHHLDREKPRGYQRILGNLQRLWQSSSPQQPFLRRSQICLMRNSCTVWKLTRSRKVSLSFNSTLVIQGIFPKEYLDFHVAVTWSSTVIKKLRFNFQQCKLWTKVFWEYSWIFFFKP